MATPTIKQISEVITEMDCAAQGAFTEIATIAKMALESLEHQVGFVDPDRIAIILKFIWARSVDAENSVNSLASDVGLSYVDEAMHRRSDARHKAKKSTSNQVTV